MGFKAVFQYTDTPEIYDDYFKFKIENYIVPTLLSCDHPDRREGETLFVFPFKDVDSSFTDIFERLKNLKNPILFLRHLQRIVWRVDKSEAERGKEYIYSKEVLKTVRYNSKCITLEHYRLQELSATREILLFSKDIQVTDKDAKVSNHVINVGFYYDADQKKLVTKGTQNIYCFFPTKETFDTCFVSHAPFLLTDNRQNLKPNENLNKDLVKLLAQLAADAVVLLCGYRIDEQTRLIDENLTDIIPSFSKIDYHYYLDNSFQRPLENAFSRLVDNERVFLSRGGKYLTLQESYVGSPRDLVDLISRKQLSQLRSYNFDEDDPDEMKVLKNMDFLKWELSQNIEKREDFIFDDINKYDSVFFAIDVDEDFMGKQEFRWVTKMYTFLRTAAPKLWKITDKEKCNKDSNYPFRKAHIIKTQKGEWVAPFIENTIPNVYLPLKDDSSSNYNFIAKEYIENETAMKFFEELGIQKPDEFDYIRQVILKKYQGLYFTIEPQELKSDFDVLVGYYRDVKDYPRKREEYLDQLKDKLYLFGRDNHLHKTKDLFFYRKALEAYYIDKRDYAFFNSAFYASAYQHFERVLVEEFVEALGVRRYPNIIKSKRNNYTTTKELRDRIAISKSCWEYRIEDYELEWFDVFSDSRPLSIEASLFLWNEVLPSIQLAQYESLTLSEREKYARHETTKTYPSTFLYLLQHKSWLFDTNDKVVSAKKVVIEDLDSRYNRNNGLIQFLGIEKREKSIIELGGTAEQQEQMELGKKLQRYLEKLTPEEMFQKMEEAIREKLQKEQSVDSHATGKEPAHGSAPDSSSSGRKERSTNKHVEPDIVVDDDNIVEDTTYSREELRKTAPSDMFVNSRSPHKPAVQTDVETSEEEDVDGIVQKLKEQEDKHNKVKELRETAHTAEKYSKEWFDALIELEYRGGAETEKGLTNNSISITFNSVCKEPGSERIYILNNPSRSVPLWLEEIGDIEVKCAFSNRDEMTLTFEVANVRDNSLRLKASKSYESVLDKIEWKRCTRASITLKNQIDLMGKLRTAFNSLDLDEGFNLKENLTDDIQFIFGPPGTGKTTTLAKKIIMQMTSGLKYRVLVLAPTNTACDELARKIRECSQGNCPWLHRFVATSDEDLEDIVVDRESLVFDDDRCCLISTIARLSFDGFNGAKGYNRLLDIVWDQIICDEASMIPLAEISLAIYNFANTPFLIAGDPMQIMPILHEEEWKEENIYTMVKLDRFDDPKTEPIQFAIENLNMQYRSVPAIGELFSQYAYDGKLKHYRRPLEASRSFGRLVLKPINFMPFKVEKYDSIFGIKKLDGSNVHIYSVLFTFELFKYLSASLADQNDKEFSIGIVCPYAPQAQLIESLIAQTSEIPSHVKVTVGTVHRFQGGQCNLMLVVLNPPLGMKNAADRIFLNNKNILNVAISRAQDYLCILMPHRDTDGFENLYEINKIGSIAMRDPSAVLSYTCDEVEETILDRKFYIESNTFVTSHQLANVYTKAVKKYEVRIDEKSVDIQIGTSGKKQEI